ncbi:dihydropyrimidinase isoform X2 [Pararge aegeria]|uniref:dihydropyrimidinase n=2 Tax=Pararge aegeria TaxID=116150 RepID=A0A8S4S3F1_9NEOP|nr:dihydropyrimidinase isoform X2 [Pararge aegeria]CAH2248854.1 jg7555 [Pararge aegeria aegeria]
MSNAPVKKVPIHLQSSQNRLLIKNGQVVNYDGMEDADVYIEDGIIKQVGRNLIIPGGTRIIDATRKLVMPGGIDPHTHFELEMMGAKAADDFYKGTRAAVAGGTTTVLDFVLPEKGQSLVEAYNNWREKADNKVCCDYGLHVGVTWWSPSVKKEMQQLVAEHGINSFKMFMAYKDTWMLNDYDLCQAFETCAELKALPQVHAENGHIIARNTEKLLAAGVTTPEGHELSRDEEVEAEAVNRACVIANQMNSPLYIVHMMSKSAVDALRLARSKQKQPIFGETLAATVGTDGSHYKNACFRHAAAHVLSPPLRSDPYTPEAIIEALAVDDLQLIGSDNCTFNEKDKERGKDDFSKIPNGVNGVEDRMAVLWQKAVNSGLMDPCRFVAVTSTNAARIFNLWPAKGRVAVGSDADVVVWDPQLERTISAATHHHALNFNIFEGTHVVGSPQYVIVNGRVCLDDGELRVAEGLGKFLPTPANSPYVYGGKAPSTPQSTTLHYAPDSSPARVTNGTPTELDLVNKQLDGLSVSGCSTPTGRKMREPGQRNLQNSTFSISKEVEGLDTKTSVRVRNPPGGKSSGLW